MPTEWAMSPKQAEYMGDTTRILVVEGSAGSGKTIFAVHKVIQYAITHKNAYMGIFRLTFPSLRRTSLREIENYLRMYNIQYKLNKAESTIKILKTGTTMVFSGLDELEKIRSMNLDYIYVEQCEEVPHATFIELERRLRGSGVPVQYLQMLLVVTPEDETHWIYQMFHKSDKWGKWVHFHYTDNIFLPDDYLANYENLKEIDYELYRKYTEGKWGKLTNIVYENWDNKRLTRGVEYYTAGLDFGYNNPSAFVLIAWYDNDPYIMAEVYRKGLTNHELIMEIKSCLSDLHLKPNQLDTVFADSAEPDRIQEFCDAGFNCKPVQKAKNAETNKPFIKQSIESVRVQKLHIYEECVDTLKEIRSYKYQKDKDGVVLDIPVKMNDHAMDAMRYCIYGTVGASSPFRKDLDYEPIYGH